MTRLFAFVIFLALSTGSLLAQDYFGLKIARPGSSENTALLKLMEQKPEEVMLSIHCDLNGQILFSLTDASWFTKFFTSPADGLAVDILRKEQYDCDSIPEYYNTPIKGRLLEPVFLPDMEANMKILPDSQLLIPLGSIPKELLHSEIELNLALIRNNSISYYISYYHLESYRWDLLDMGFYFDTLTYVRKAFSKWDETYGTGFLSKTLRFEIPFEQNKSDYSPEDIRPLYDSLKLTDYDIKKITVRAYSSVEGTTERNRELQEERAQNIVSALQSYQDPSIIQEIHASENWVDFFSDIIYTRYSFLADWGKEEIKAVLAEKKVAEELEPILRKHRKAIIVLDLRKKEHKFSRDTEELFHLFPQSLEEKNLERAVEIQKAVFEKITDHELPASAIDRLEVPRRSEYSLLLFRNAVFRYLTDVSDVFQAYRELEELLDLMPGDFHLRYNLCSLKFRMWIMREDLIDLSAFREEIQDLQKGGIPEALVDRMLINYEILMSEYHMRNRDYISKNKALNYIYVAYKHIPLSDDDYLNLAQYFSSYARTDWAIRIIEKRAGEIDVSEDLLFYYLNLTLVDERMFQVQEFRKILFNAWNINPQRFCRLFDSNMSGGVTFQLLENPELKDSYCENCR
ncbi:MAG: hypothetical protein ACOYXB_06450 [Bacteroidota bacterium]